jgi:hypothetical protein
MKIKEHRIEQICELRKLADKIAKENALLSPEILPDGLNRLFW